MEKEASLWLSPADTGMAGTEFSNRLEFQALFILTNVERIFVLKIFGFMCH